MIERYKIYKKAIGLKAAANEAVNALEKIGLMPDFDDTTSPVMKLISSAMNDAADIATEAMGMELKEEKGHMVTVADMQVPVTMHVFYPCENSEKGDFSITYDGMFDALDKAAENEHFAEMVWHCFAEKDEYAKKWLTEQGIIGFALEGSE